MTVYQPVRQLTLHNAGPQGYFTRGYEQGRNNIRWRPRQEASLAPPNLNLRSFGSKCTVLKKVGLHVSLLGLIGARRSHSARPTVIWHAHIDSAPGELCPPCPLVTYQGTKTDIGPLAWVLIEICKACLYSNQNIETAAMLRFSNIATSAAVLFWAWWQKNSMSTYIHPDPSTSRARVRCTSCTRRS